MTKTDLLYRLEKARNLYVLAKEIQDTDQMQRLEGIGRNIHFRLKHCLCMWCKFEEKTVTDWPFCGEECTKEYEKNRPQVKAVQGNTAKIDAEFRKRMERVPEVLALIRQKQREAAALPKSEYRHD